eukprot:c18607_g1_i3.p1 GENE.c18607_g1_i3~~c18607_g1_i3.p1  ORF type:complete len:294 (+),score=39.27 c18607_g1_i3:494-1375(+)
MSNSHKNANIGHLLDVGHVADKSLRGRAVRCESRRAVTHGVIYIPTRLSTEEDDTVSFFWLANFFVCQSDCFGRPTSTKANLDHVAQSIDCVSSTSRPTPNRVHLTSQPDLGRAVPIVILILIRVAPAAFLSASLSHQFAFMSCIGRGGFGKVFRAVSQLDGEEYAIKVIRLGRAPDLSEMDSGVLAEVACLSEVGNLPNIVGFHQAWVKPAAAALEEEVSSSGSASSIASSFSNQPPSLRHSEDASLASHAESDHSDSQSHSSTSGKRSLGPPAHSNGALSPESLNARFVPT